MGKRLWKALLPLLTLTALIVLLPDNALAEDVAEYLSLGGRTPGDQREHQWRGLELRG